MFNMGMGPVTGGPKYRENWHNFQGAVAGYTLTGIAAMIIIHAVVFQTSFGHAKWMHIWGAMASIAK